MKDVYIDEAPVSLAACRRQCWESKTCYGVYQKDVKANGNGICVNWLKADIKGRCTDTDDKLILAICKENIKKNGGIQPKCYVKKDNYTCGTKKAIIPGLESAGQMTTVRIPKASTPTGRRLSTHEIAASAGETAIEEK